MTMTRDMFEQMFTEKKFNEKGEIVLTKAAFDRVSAAGDRLGYKLIANKRDEQMFGVCPIEVEKPKKADMIGTIRVQPQIHTKTNKDIKFWSGKAGEYGVKALTHIAKNGAEELRVFISFKDDKGKLRRFRLRTDEVEGAATRKELVAICESLTADDITEALA